jgi:hypothetical protein
MKLVYVCYCGNEMIRPIKNNELMLLGAPICDKCGSSKIPSFKIINESDKNKDIKLISRDEDNNIVFDITCPNCGKKLPRKANQYTWDGNREASIRCSCDLFLILYLDDFIKYESPFLSMELSWFGEEED